MKRALVFLALVGCAESSDDTFTPAPSATTTATTPAPSGTATTPPASTLATATFGPAAAAGDTLTSGPLKATQVSFARTTTCANNLCATVGFAR